MGETVGKTWAEKVEAKGGSIPQVGRGRHTLRTQAGHCDTVLGGSLEGLFSGWRQKVL
jgi:hypothetical protein